MARPLQNLLNKRFGRLLVIAQGQRWEPGYRYYLCHCDCGKEKEFMNTNLLNKNAQSCGCLRKEKYRELSYRQKQSSPGSGFRRVLAQYKSDAKKRGLVWELTDDQAKTLMTLRCHYTGRFPAKEMYFGADDVFLYNGIDRIDNEIGYIWSNCVPCCHEINMMKHRLPYDVFIELCKEVANSRVEEVLCQS
jgi:hypothetical protein